MPYKSVAQRGWAHTKEGMKALGGKNKVAEWDSSSKGLKLPPKVKAPKTKLTTSFAKAQKASSNKYKGVIK